MKAIILCLFLTSCGMKLVDPARFQSRAAIFESFLGQSTEQLQRLHGKPSKIVFTPSGRILVYEGAWKKDSVPDAKLTRSFVKFTVTGGIITKWESNMCAFILVSRRE